MRLRFALVLSLVSMIVLAGSVSAETPTQQAMATTQPQQGCVYFAETSHNLCAGFLRYWQAYGGLAIFGYPITEEFVDPDIGLTVQWFERGRFEWHPGKWPEYWDVLLGHVGGIYAQQRGLYHTDAFHEGATCAERSTYAVPLGGRAGDGPKADCRDFLATGHTLRAGFLRYWETYGGFAIFGYPLSEEFVEDGMTVQYFERARFEWQPGTWPERWDVHLGRLGVSLTTSFTYALPGNQVFPEGVTYDETTGHFYVSSTGDGTIFRGHLSEDEAHVFLPGGSDGRTFAAGLAVEDGLLYVSGGGTGQMFVYDASSGAMLASFKTDASPTFINDVEVGRPETAFFTDSMNPYLYRVYRDASGDWQMETWLDFTGTELVYQQGFNVNGIATTEGGEYLILVQSNTGKLFRVDLNSKAVAEIDLGGASMTAGDGIVLVGHTLYVVRNQLGQIAVVELSDDYASGTLRYSFTDPTLRFPTTAAFAEGRLLVVNSQFNRRMGDTGPELPFSVSSVPVPWR